jgi:hypothetical protein
MYGKAKAFARIVEDSIQQFEICSFYNFEADLFCLYSSLANHIDH